jgi:hypothetical protein
MALKTVTIQGKPIRLASWPQRILARTVDLALIIAILAVLPGIFQTLALAICLPYFFIGDGLLQGRNLGKRIVGLKVLDAKHGTACTFSAIGTWRLSVRRSLFSWLTTAQKVTIRKGQRHSLSPSNRSTPEKLRLHRPLRCALVTSMQSVNRSRRPIANRDCAPPAQARARLPRRGTEEGNLP